jgi:hypothetical protein
MSRLLRSCASLLLALADHCDALWLRLFPDRRFVRGRSLDELRAAGLHEDERDRPTEPDIASWTISETQRASEAETLRRAGVR